VPHRAIIFLAVLLTAVAVAGGLLGVTNASQAEQATARLSRQYLVLQPPVRQIRASVADFQVLATEAFGYLDSGVHHRVAPRAYRGEFRRTILPRATTAAL
jgi:hypothetical protein